MDVVRSFHDINFFSEEREQKPLNQIVYRNTSIMPEVQDRLVSSVTHYYEWNALIAAGLKAVDRPALMLRLEDLISQQASRDALSSFLGRDLVFPDGAINQKLAEKDAHNSASYDSVRALALIRSAMQRFGSFGYPL